MAAETKTAPISAEVLAAVAWCHLGSSQVQRTFEEADIYEAERLGLLKHHPTWHATERGIGALIAAGMCEGTAAPETVRVHVLWARTNSPFIQFVGAFTEGLVEAWPDTFALERADAEERFRQWLDEDEEVEFFTTVEQVVRPVAQD